MTRPVRPPAPSCAGWGLGRGSPSQEGRVRVTTGRFERDRDDDAREPVDTPVTAARALTTPSDAAAAQPVHGPPRFGERIRQGIDLSSHAPFNGGCGTDAGLADVCGAIGATGASNGTERDAMTATRDLRHEIWRFKRFIALARYVRYSGIGWRIASQPNT